MLLSFHLSSPKQHMPDSIHFYEPRAGHGLPHDPFNAIVGPRPIGWISSHDSAGALNLAPYSFFNAFNYTPPIVGFASIGYKDTVRNVEQTGEFVWNLATRDLAEAMNQTCAAVPPDVDEFALAGLTPIASRVISVPRVAESPVSFECRMTQIVQLQGVDGEKVPTWLVLGRWLGCTSRRRC
ncbi:Asp/Glu/hydantoin racemase [Pseudoduganella plicata]|uniref:Asp/Glu/hydantoin racemase n=1 Tax=Pseudoduganella plicata TaxID=321984 RepID=A0AA87YDB7_9BURK|nr:Asp/Glu/hydantoin racemase [Pseudoduganella plicata]